MDLFVTATKKKFRFETVRGLVSTEDLWDMPLTSRDGFDLDSIAIKLDEAVDTKSFVKRKTPNENTSQQKLEIVKYVIDTKISEIERAEQIQVNKEKREKLLSALQNKEDAKLASMSEEEIRKELEKL